MTLRQYLMIRWTFVKKAFQLGRRLTEAEMHEAAAQAINEAQVLASLVGAITITWAQVELNLDVINGILIGRGELNDRELPVSLKPKIAFFKKAFVKVAEVAHLDERALLIVAELNRLKLIRHDIIHGVAMDRTQIGARKFIRVEYRGADLVFRHQDYKFPAITEALADMVKLKGNLFALFRDTLFVISPDAAKQTFG